MGKAILLDTYKEDKDATFTYYVDPPLGNGYSEHLIMASKKSRLIKIIFRPTEHMGELMEVWLLDELEKFKDRVSFEYFEKKMKGFDPEKMDPEPFLESIGYNIL